MAPEPPGRGDGLQPRDAGADDEHLRRADRPGRGRQHRQETCPSRAPRSARPCSPRSAACEDSASIDCAREMRGISSIANAVMRPSRSARTSVQPLVTVDEAHDDRAGLETRDLVERGRLHLDEHVGGGEHLRQRNRRSRHPSTGRPGTGLRAGPPLDQHAGTGRPELGCHLGHECDPRLIWRRLRAARLSSIGMSVGSSGQPGPGLNRRHVGEFSYS